MSNVSVTETEAETPGFEPRSSASVGEHSTPHHHHSPISCFLESSKLDIGWSLIKLDTKQAIHVSYVAV